VGLFLAGAVLAVLWVRNESRAAEPLVDMRMMRIRGVWTVNTAGFLIGAGMFSSFVLIPQFTEMPRAAGFGFHASVTQAGLYLLPSTMMMLLVSPLGGRMANRVGSRMPLVLGCLATSLAFVLLAVAHARPWEFYLSSAILGVGIGLAFAALANLIVEAVRPDQTGVATGMNTVMRSLGGSVGSQVGASIIAGTVVGHALPTEHGFTIAFALAATFCGLATLASLAVPRPGAPARHPSTLVADRA
jgi:MFS family permease